MSTVPPDLIADILSRLPVKDLLRFRCVSEKFRSLIDSSYFVNLHLTHSVSSHTNHTLILNHFDGGLHVGDLPSLNSFSKVQHPLVGDDLTILGSCNGLLCVCNKNGMAILNPSMKKHINLPCLLPWPCELYFIDYGSCKWSAYGFGYDSVNDDYKVVGIAQSGGIQCRALLESEVRVLSMGRKEWKRIEDLPYFLPYRVANGVFSSGCLHWVVSCKDEPANENVIVALDLGVEEYREVPQPEYADNKKFRLEVGVLGGCLCLMANYVKSHVDLWVMREYGVKESWIKLLSVACDEVVGPWRSMKPLAYSRGGDEVLLTLDCTRLVWYDLKKKKTKNDSTRGMSWSGTFEICPQSLVPLDVKKRKMQGSSKWERIKRRS